DALLRRMAPAVSADARAGLPQLRARRRSARDRRDVLPGSGARKAKHRKDRHGRRRRRLRAAGTALLPAPGVALGAGLVLVFAESYGLHLHVYLDSFHFSALPL